MKLTNKNDLPAPLVATVAHFARPRDRSEIGDFSVTELIGPARQHQLALTHYDELQEDVSANVYALLGHGLHDLMERHAGSDLIVEKRLHASLTPTRGGAAKKISGKFDLIDDRKTLVDYKVSSIWEAKNGLKQDRIDQLNCYDYLCHLNGINIRKAEVTMIFRDWSKMAVMRESDYPKSQVQTFNVPLWTHDEQHAFIRDRIQVHVDAQLNLPECTDDERWTRPTVFAVDRTDRKRAIKILDTREGALKYIDSIKKDREAHFITERTGESIRCDNYCIVAEFCKQYLKQGEFE